MRLKTKFVWLQTTQQAFRPDDFRLVHLNGRQRAF